MDMGARAAAHLEETMERQAGVVVRVRGLADVEASLEDRRSQSSHICRYQ